LQRLIFEDTAEPGKEAYVRDPAGTFASAAFYARVLRNSPQRGRGRFSRAIITTAIYSISQIGTGRSGAFIEQLLFSSKARMLAALPQVNDYCLVTRVSYAARAVQA